MMFVSACGRKEVAATLETTEDEATVDKDHVYRWEDVEIPLEGNIQFISSCMYVRNFCILCGQFLYCGFILVVVVLMVLDKRNISKIER